MTTDNFMAGVCVSFIVVQCNLIIIEIMLTNISRDLRELLRDNHNDGGLNIPEPKIRPTCPPRPKENNK
jgi:hypothetical protein